VRRKTWALGAVVLAAAAATGGVVAMSSADQATRAAQEPPANTATVERGKLSDLVSEYGILTYRARSDGSPYAVINRARGTYTKLPDAGDKADCGDVLYRVNDHPVLLLCGSTPAYRSLSEGDSGPDVTDPEPEGRIMLRANGPIDPESAQFKEAEQACEEFTPGHSGSSQGEGRTP
jgi:hypothetical protein